MREERISIHTLVKRVTHPVITTYIIKRNFNSHSRKESDFEDFDELVDYLQFQFTLS